MSELIQKIDNRATIRWKLLTGVSALALTAYVSSASVARAEDSTQPQIWIELGGGLERLDSPQQAFSPPFMPSVMIPAQQKALAVQTPPAYGLEEEANVSFQPVSSDWLIAASIRYGRSNAKRHHHQQTRNVAEPFNFTYYGNTYSGSLYPSRYFKFADGQSDQSERHLFVDFEAGKDVGLGLFGMKGSSVVSAGVRIAQLTSQSHIAMHLRPDLQYPTAPITSVTDVFALLRGTGSPIQFHDYAASAGIQRSFSGFGPKLTWNASAPIAGNEDAGELALDWGLNGAVLFGRQKVSGHHQTATTTFDKNGFRVIGGFHTGPASGYIYTQSVTHNTPPPVNINRSREVTVPDVGATIGLSYRYANAKIKFGYRADMFFGAIDGGIDARKNENRAFYGPYASISIGLGD
jgi:iron complex outermembrane receptor protein